MEALRRSCMATAGTLLLVGYWAGTLGTAHSAEVPGARVVIIAGRSDHPPGTHEVAAGARLLKHCLEHAENLSGWEVEVLADWPATPAALGPVSAVVFIGDLFPPERMADPPRVKAELGNLMNQGCGLVCLHYATGLRGEHVGAGGEHPLLSWIGGYFATAGCTHHRSVARVVRATLDPEPGQHPVLRGWRAFTIDDEPYWNNYFGPAGPAANVTLLVSTMLPPEQPQKQIVGWAIQRQDGGRGVGIVVPHYYQNWCVDDLRMLVLNAICWAAQQEVPADGVKSPVPNLESFRPAAVRPLARGAAAPAAR